MVGAFVCYCSLVVILKEKRKTKNGQELGQDLHQMNAQRPVSPAPSRASQLPSLGA